MKDPITGGMRIGAAVFGFFKARKQSRKADKKAKRGEPVDEVAEEFNSTNDEVSMNPFPQGTQTLSGIAVLVLAPWLAKYGIDNAQVQAIVAAGGTLIGAGIAIAGYYRRKKLPAE